MTPYYADDLATLYLGDSAEVLGALEPASFGLVFTSPPYNLGTSTGGGMGRGSGYTSAGVTFTAPADLAGGYADGFDDALEPEEYDRWLAGILAASWALVGPAGALFLNHKPRIQAGECLLPTRFLAGVAPLRQVITWDRGTGLNWSDRFYLPRSEWLMVYARPEWRLVDRQAAGLGDVWRVAPEPARDHPAPFPVELPHRAIVTTAPGLVLDPFAGSGTTLVAASLAGVRSVGIERSERYAEVAARRLAASHDRPLW